MSDKLVENIKEAFREVPALQARIAQLEKEVTRAYGDGWKAGLAAAATYCEKQGANSACLLGAHIRRLRVRKQK